MRSVALLLLAFLLMALESPLLAEVGIAAYVPDLALVVTIYLGLTTPFERGLALAAGVGLMHDAFALGAPVGLHMEIAVLTFLVSHRVSRHLVLRGPLGSMIIAFTFSIGATLVELVLSLIFVRSFTQGVGGPGPLLTAMVPQALVTAPFGAVFFWLLDRLDGFVTKRNESVFS